MSIAVNSIAPAYTHVSVKRRKNVWISARDGNWTDPTVWESNAIKRWNYPGQNIAAPVFPQVGDDVYINHVVTLNAGASASPLVVNNLYISGTFKADNSSRAIVVNGDIQATGSVDFTSSNVNMFLYGFNNYISSFTSGTSSTVTYANNTYSQNIMDLSYRNLTTIGNAATKYFINDNTVTGNLSVQGNTEIGSFNLTVNGTTTLTGMSANNWLSKSGSGNVIFVGVVNFGNGSNTVNFSAGNPTVELRAGISAINTSNVISRFQTGTGTWNFTTTNQSIINGGGTVYLYFDAPIIIASGITLTLVNANLKIYLNNAAGITGASSTSKLLNSTSSTIVVNNASATIMATGIFDPTITSTSVIEYALAGNYTLPYSAYAGLTISSLTGTKTLGRSTTVSGNLSIISGGVLELSNYNLTVSGTSTVVSASVGYSLTKSGAGSVLFIGQIIMTSNLQSIDFSGGNPSVECRGGINYYLSNNFNSGTGIWSFTTNNQSINNTSAAASANIQFSGNVLISGAITLSNTAIGSFAGDMIILGTLNGDNANSIFDNRSKVEYQNATAPMLTGKLYCNQAANTWFYDLAGDQDIQVPSDTTPGYKNLTLSTGGAKKLLGNVSVKGVYTLTSPATLNSNGFILSNP